MPVIPNRNYNDPNIGQAFTNLAGMFAPPSAQEALAYMTAKKTADETARRAELFGMAKGPAFDQKMFDRASIAAGLYAPNQSYYGVDTTAATSRSNNAADNARAMQVAKMQEEANTFRTLMQPIGEGQVRPALPAGTAQRYGLPTDPQYGTVKLSQGQTAALPDGRVLAGTPVMPTEEQVKGKILADMQSTMTPEQRAALVMGNTPVEQVQTPNGPRFAYRSQAVGQTAAPDPSKMSELAVLQRERSAIAAADPNDSRIREYDQRIMALGRGQNQSAYDKQTEDILAKWNEDIFKTATGAVADRNVIGTMLQSVNDPNVDQGAFGQALLSARKIINALGGNAGDTAPAEVMNALGNQLALRLRDPSNGGGMPGALSDSDREFLKQMVVSLGNTPEANRKIAEAFLRLNQRNLDIEQMRRDYIQSNGRLDEGFRGKVSDYLRGNQGLPGAPAPQFLGGQQAAPQAARPAPQPGAPKTGDVVDGYRFLGGNPADQSRWEAVR